MFFTLVDEQAISIGDRAYSADCITAIWPDGQESGEKGERRNTHIGISYTSMIDILPSSTIAPLSGGTLYLINSRRLFLWPVPQ